MMNDQYSALASIGTPTDARIDASGMLVAHYGASEYQITPDGVIFYIGRVSS